MNPQIDMLKKRLKTTAYARFFSARRYEKLNNYSLFSLSIASFSLIFITIFQNYSEGQLFTPKTLELTQLIASIIIATLSVVVSFSSYAIKSEKMRISGEEINSLVSKLELYSGSEVDLDKLRKIRKKYELLKEKSLNHKNFEFQYGKMERKREDNNENSSVSITAKIENLISFFPYLLISVTSCFFVILTLFLYFSNISIVKKNDVFNYVKKSPVEYICHVITPEEPKC